MKLYLPERALQSLSLTPRDLSHSKNSSSDIELFKTVCSSAETLMSACMKEPGEDYRYTCSTNVSLQCLENFIVNTKLMYHMQRSGNQLHIINVYVTI